MKKSRNVVLTILITICIVVPSSKGVFASQGNGGGISNEAGVGFYTDDPSEPKPIPEPSPKPTGIIPQLGEWVSWQPVLVGGAILIGVGAIVLMRKKKRGVREDDH